MAQPTSTPLIRRGAGRAAHHPQALPSAVVENNRQEAKPPLPMVMIRAVAILACRGGWPSPLRSVVPAAAVFFYHGTASASTPSGECGLAGSHHVHLPQPAAPSGSQPPWCLVPLLEPCAICTRSGNLFHRRRTASRLTERNPCRSIREGRENVNAHRVVGA